MPAFRIPKRDAGRTFLPGDPGSSNPGAEQAGAIQGIQAVRGSLNRIDRGIERFQREQAFREREEQFEERREEAARRAEEEQRARSQLKDVGTFVEDQVRNNIPLVREGRSITDRAHQDPEEVEAQFVEVFANEYDAFIQGNVSSPLARERALESRDRVIADYASRVRRFATEDSRAASADLMEIRLRDIDIPESLAVNAGATAEEAAAALAAEFSSVVDVNVGPGGLIDPVQRDDFIESQMANRLQGMILDPGTSMLAVNKAYEVAGVMDPEYGAQLRAQAGQILNAKAGAERDRLRSEFRESEDIAKFSKRLDAAVVEFEETYANSMDNPGVGDLAMSMYSIQEAARAQALYATESRDFLSAAAMGTAANIPLLSPTSVESLNSESHLLAYSQFAETFQGSPRETTALFERVTKVGFLPKGYEEVLRSAILNDDIQVQERAALAIQEGLRKFPGRFQVARVTGSGDSQVISRSNMFTENDPVLIKALNLARYSELGYGRNPDGSPNPQQLAFVMENPPRDGKLDGKFRGQGPASERYGISFEDFQSEYRNAPEAMFRDFEVYLEAMESQGRSVGEVGDTDIISRARAVLQSKWSQGVDQDGRETWEYNGVSQYGGPKGMEWLKNQVFFDTGVELTTENSVIRPTLDKNGNTTFLALKREVDSEGAENLVFFERLPARGGGVMNYGITPDSKMEYSLLKSKNLRDLESFSRAAPVLMQFAEEDSWMFDLLVPTPERGMGAAPPSMGPRRHSQEERLRNQEALGRLNLLKDYGNTGGLAGVFGYRSQEREQEILGVLQGIKTKVSDRRLGLSDILNDARAELEAATTPEAEAEASLYLQESEERLRAFEEMMRRAGFLESEQ